MDLRPRRLEPIRLAVRAHEHSRLEGVGKVLMTGSRESSVILETQNLTRAVGRHVLVENISIQVNKGDVLAIVGPSGAGKTSFLRLLNRLDEPTRGRVFLEGKDTVEIPPRELRTRVGMVMQLPILFPGTVTDNVQYGPRSRGEELAPDRLDSLLVQLGLPNFQERSVHQLSIGEAQRVCLARTLVNSPQVLLLDELTAPLDDQAKQEIEQLIQRIGLDQHLTCLIVTHDLEQAARMAERVMLLREGKVAKIGPIEEVLHA